MDSCAGPARAPRRAAGKTRRGGKASPSLAPLWQCGLGPATDFRGVEVGCGHGASSGPAPLSAAHDDGPATIAVEKKDAYPSMVRIVREGDPRPAVAMVVATGSGSYASAALAALLEARLGRAGFPAVDSRADRDSFRVRCWSNRPRAPRNSWPPRAPRSPPASPRAAPSFRSSLGGSPHFDAIRSTHLSPRPSPAARASSAPCRATPPSTRRRAKASRSSRRPAPRLTAPRTSLLQRWAASPGRIGRRGCPPRRSVAARQRAGKRAAHRSDQFGVYVSPDRPAGTARLTVAVLPTPTRRRPLLAGRANPTDPWSRACGLWRCPFASSKRAPPRAPRRVFRRHPRDDAPRPGAPRRRRRGARRHVGATGARHRPLELRRSPAPTRAPRGGPSDRPRAPPSAWRAIRATPPSWVVSGRSARPVRATRRRPTSSPWRSRSLPPTRARLRSNRARPPRARAGFQRRSRAMLRRTGTTYRSRVPRKTGARSEGRRPIRAEPRVRRPRESGAPRRRRRPASRRPNRAR